MLGSCFASWLRLRAELNTFFFAIFVQLVRLTHLDRYTAHLLPPTRPNSLHSLYIYSQLFKLSSKRAQSSTLNCIDSGCQEYRYEILKVISLSVGYFDNKLVTDLCLI